MKNNSKKTNKQNTARSAQNTTRRMSRRTKDERRNILFSKKHVKMETHRALYGTDHGAAYALALGTDLSRRFVAAFLTLVFVLTTMIVGYNITGKAVSGNNVAANGTYQESNIYVFSYRSRYNRGSSNYGETVTIPGSISFSIQNGKFHNISLSIGSVAGERRYCYDYRSGNTWYIVPDQLIQLGVNQALQELQSLEGQDATYANAEAAISNIYNYTLFSAPENAGYNVMVETFLDMVADAPQRPDPPAEIDIVTPEMPVIPDSAQAYLELDKTIAPSSDGKSYDLTLDSYTTANIEKYDIKEKVPTDYVLVIDQSGSMAKDDMPTEYEAAPRKLTLNQIADSIYNSDNKDQYYINVDGKTYRVFPERSDLFEYVPRNTVYIQELLDRRGLSWGQGISEQEQAFNSQYYYQPKADKLIAKTDPDVQNDDNFYPLTILTSGEPLRYQTVFRYTDKNGTPRYMKFWYDRAEKGEDYTTSDAIWYYNSVSDITGSGRFGPGDRFLTYGYERINGLVVRVAKDGAGIGGSIVWLENPLRVYPKAGASPNYTYAQFVGLNTGMYIQNTMFIRHVGYTKLCYRDDKGIIHTIKPDVPTVIGDGNETVYCNANGEPLTDKEGSVLTYSGLLKSVNTSNERRLTTLETALQSFAKSLQTDVDSFGIVDNRVAVVGFSSGGGSSNNTEVLTGVDISSAQSGLSSNTSNQYFPYNTSDYVSTNNGATRGTNYNGPQYYNNTYGRIGTAYGTALIDATIPTDNDKVRINPDLLTAFNSLTASGGTQPEDGLEMAHQIYNAIPEDEQYYTVRSGDNKGQTVKRNRVVIYFTDGQPGNNSEADQYDEANDVVEKAHVLKKDDKALIFSIGVFGVSDTEPLTYQYAAPSNPNEEYEYEPGYVYTVTSENNYFFFDTTSYHYLFRYWRTGDPNNFGTEANDTIFDYMSTVSSNYPDAEKFVSDNWVTSGGSSLKKDDSSEYYSNWLDMTGDVRGDLIDNYGYGEGLKNYYRLASNQESLIDAFRSAVDITEVQENQGAGEISGTTVLKDIVNTDNFVITEDTEVIIQVIPSTRAKGSDIVTPTATPRAPDAGDTITYAWGEKTEQIDRSNELIVRGFDYNAHHIAWDNDASQQLRVIIKGLVPKADATGEALTSNRSDSGIYANDSDDADMLKAFPEPAIARYAYELNVTDADADAKFNLEYTLTANSGVTADFDNILISGEGLPAGTASRELYSAGTLKNVANVTNGSKIYLEYITEQGGNGVVNPADYSLAASIAPSSADASSYTYYLDTTNYVDLDNLDPNKILPQPNGMTISTFSTTANGAMFVDSIANNRDVTIHLNADDSPYVDSSYKFKVNITLTGTGIAQKLSTVNSDNNGVIQFTANGEDTLVGVLELTRGTVDPIELAATIKVPDGATLAVGHTDPFYNTETPFKYTDESVSTKADYSAHAINTATHIYIVDTVNNDVGAGVAEDNNSSRIILYVLGGLAAVSTGAGTVYVYRKKDEFVEQ